MPTNNLLFYDVEVFKEDTFVVFKDIDKNTIAFYHNDFEGIVDTIHEKTLVGFNNYFYDDHILTAMISNWTPYQIKQLNDDIIHGSRDVRRTVHPLIDSLDVFQQIHVSRPSLKRIEGNMGRMILESSVDFDIDRKLTPEELRESIRYCEYDVDTTIDVYKEREHTYFQTKGTLLDMYGNERVKKWNTTTISANLLLSKPLPKWSSLRVDDELYNLVPPDVKEMWWQANKPIMNIKKKSVTIRDFDNSIQFGFGGLHGVHKHIKKMKNVVLLDVSSMYPSIIILLEALGHATKQYKEIRDRRIEVKHKDKPLSDALKLIINSVYGLLNNKYSMLNNPRAAYTVCVYGQIALYELCKRLSTVSTILNINTDGVIFKADSDAYKAIVEPWERDFGLNLEEEHYDLLIQRDVNNYIAVQGDKIKVKGGDVSRYNHPNHFGNNSMRIVDIAIVEHLVYGRDVLDVIQEHMDRPELFQIILQAGNTYKGTYDEHGNKYNKVNRVFAGKERDKSTVTLYKLRQDGGTVRFPDTPDHMILWNDEASAFEDFRKRVDINFYYKLIMKKLEKWL